MSQRFKKIFQNLLTEGPLISLVLAIISLRNVIANPLILGRKFDWYIPLFDLKPLLSHSLFAWNNESSGSPVGYYSAWINDFLYGVIGYLGIKPVIFIPLLLVFTLTLAGYGLQRLLRMLHVPWPIAIIAGLFYMLSPVVYIREIIGFTIWLVAYALAPWILLLYLRAIHHRSWLIYSLWAGVLLGLASAQIQFALMISLPLIILAFSKGLGIKFSNRLFRLSLVFLTAIFINLPWFLALMSRSLNSEVAFLASSSAVLKSITDLPHSLLRTIFLNEHHITADFFDLNNRLGYYFWPNLIFLALCLIGLVALWRHIALKYVLVVSWLIGFFITILPHRHLLWLYDLVFNTSKLTNLFREVYHAQFLMALSLSILIGSLGRALYFKFPTRKSQILVFSLALLFLLTFNHVSLLGDYNGYVAQKDLDPNYQKLAKDLKAESQQTRVWYPLGLGFIQQKGDKVGASNGDVLARSNNLPFVDQSSSVLNLPNSLINVRNSMLHQFQQGKNIDPFLKKLGVSKVIERKDLKSLNVATLNVENSNQKIKKYWQKTESARAIDPNLWQKNESYYPIIIFDKQVKPEKIYPSPKLEVASANLKDLQSSSDLVYLDQNPNKDEILKFGPILANVSDTDLKASLSPARYRTNLASAADENYKATQGWSQGRFSWWYDENFSSLVSPFIFTNVKDIIKAKIDTDLPGFHQVLVRVWYSPEGGLLSLGVGDKSIQINTQAKEKEWRWETLNNVVVSDQYQDVEVSNISGSEQAVAEIVFLPWPEVEKLDNKVSAVKKNAQNWPKSQKLPEKFESKFINPSKYQVKISNSEPFLLVMAESFDPHWQLIIGAKTYSPIVVNGWANGFWLDENYTNQSGTIYYTPQNWYNLGLILAFLAIFGVIGYSTYLYIKRRRLG